MNHRLSGATPSIEVGPIPSVARSNDDKLAGVIGNTAGPSPGLAVAATRLAGFVRVANAGHGADLFPVNKYSVCVVFTGPNFCATVVSISERYWSFIVLAW